MQPIMFHYFHDKESKRVDGSLSAKQLETIITNKDYPVLDFEKWLEKFKNGTLADNETCLTFDDGIREQYDIAIEVLNAHSVKGLFNFCTFYFCGEKDNFEIYRHFRNNYFDNIDHFYEEYFKFLEKTNHFEEYLNICNNVDFESYLSHATYYSIIDRKFRYIRDNLLKNHHYDVMDGMMKLYGVDIALTSKKLWITPKEIKEISKDHTIGIHSHEHPTFIDQWTYEQQLESYSKNKSILESYIGREIQVCVYPCGKYNEKTKDVLAKLGITSAYIASKREELCSSKLFSIPRIDSTDFIKLLEKSQ